MPLNRIPFMNIHLDNITTEEALDYIDEWIASRRIGQIITPNCDQIVQVENNPVLKPIWDDAELLFADGHPLLWFAKWYKTPLREKINGSSFVPQLCARAAEKGYSVFLLGAATGVADKAAENLKKAYPGIHIAGTFSPSYGFEKKPEEVAAINAMLRCSQAGDFRLQQSGGVQHSRYHQCRCYDRFSCRQQKACAEVEGGQRPGMALPHYQRAEACGRPRPARPRHLSPRLEISSPQMKNRLPAVFIIFVYYPGKGYSLPRFLPLPLLLTWAAFVL